MTLGTFLALLLVTAAAAFVLAPLFRADAAQEERRSAKVSDEQDLFSQREMAMAALKDLEDDRATGKIDMADYEDGKARLTSRAAAVLKRLDEIAERNSDPKPQLVSSNPDGTGAR